MRGFPCICITTIPQSEPTQTSIIAGSCSPVTSFTIATPAAKPAAATSALQVSIDTATASFETNFLITGMTREISSSEPTSAAPGRVDSPPTSRISAPSSMKRRAADKVSIGSRCKPPSENESGVTLSIAMTSAVSSRSQLNLPAFHKTRELCDSSSAGLHSVISFGIILLTPLSSQ